MKNTSKPQLAARGLQSAFVGVSMTIRRQMVCTTDNTTVVNGGAKIGHEGRAIVCHLEVGC